MAEAYQEAYLTLMRAVEKAERILIEAQRECEEQIIQEKEDQVSYLVPKRPEASRRTSPASQLVKKSLNRKTDFR